MKARHFPIANTILALSGGTFLATYPFLDHSGWALLNHMSGAALVGGLADWYAVTALFRKPLGISYKTAILPNSKEKIVSMSRDMVARELITVPHLYRTIKEIRPLEQIIEFFVSSHRKEGEEVVRLLVRSVLTKFPLERIKEDALRLGKEGILAWKVTPYLLPLLRYIVTREGGERLWLYMNRLLQRAVSGDWLRPYLEALVYDVFYRYEEGHEFRQWINEIFTSKERLTEQLRGQLLYYLRENESFDSPLAKEVRRLAEEGIDRLETDENWQSRLEQIKAQAVEKIDISAIEWKESLQKLTKGASLEDFSIQSMQTYGKELLHDENRMKEAERWLLYRLISMLRMIQPQIEEAVVRELSRYSAQEISDMVEEKLGYDLQMVRINGSLVGAILGGLFYLLSLGLKGGGL